MKKNTATKITDKLGLTTETLRRLANLHVEALRDVAGGLRDASDACGSKSRPIGC